MSWLGKIFNTLQYNVDKNIKESLYENKSFLDSRWGLVERNILIWSKSYIYYAFLLFVLAFSVSSNLLLWEVDLAKATFKYFPYWKKLIEWQDILFTAQLTIAAVIYPLAIGLVSLLFQNKSSKKTLIPVYKKYSGVMFAGLSGFLLAIFILISFLLSASLTDSSYLALCLTSVIWMMFNVLLTIWFFISTFKLLDEKSAKKLMMRYTIHEWCEHDIRNRLRGLLLENCINNKLLTNTETSVLSVKTYHISDDEMQHVDIQYNSPHLVHNVNFRFLNAIIGIQILKLKSAHWFLDLTVSKWIASKGWTLFNKKENSKPVIVINPYWQSKPKKLSLIKYSNINLSKLTCWLVKKCFKTSSEDNELDAESLVFIVQGIIGEAQDAIRDKDISAFKIAMNDISHWHCEIASAIGFINDNKDEDNWLLLPNSGWFSRSYLDELLTEYYLLSKAATELIPENSEFYVQAIYLHKRIFSRRDQKIVKEGVSLIQGSYFMWSLLMEWRSYSSHSSELRIANKYEDVLYDFVGSWEGWLDYIELRSKRSVESIENWPYFLSHLEYTAHMPITALRYGNIEAAGWGVDMLNNWFRKFSFDRYRHEEYSWHSQIITHATLNVQPENELWTAITNNEGYKADVAFELAVANTAFDIRILTACYMLLKPNSADDEKIKEYVQALLNGSPIHPTGGIDNAMKACNSPSDILGAYIRQRNHGHYEERGYGAWLTKILDSFGRVNESKKVSGRIYSGWGANDPRSINKAFIEIAISLSTSKWQLNSRWIELIFSDVFRHLDRDAIKSDLNEWLKVASEIDGSILISASDFEEKKSHFNESINEVIKQLDNRQSQAIIDAPLDEELLKQLGFSCSESINNLQVSPSYPVKLFNSISSSLKQNEGNFYSANVTQYPKERVALGLETNRAINEDEWLRDAIDNDLNIRIMRYLVHYQDIKPIEFDTNSKIIKALINSSKEIDKPILFIGDHQLNVEIRKSRYNPDASSDFNVEYFDGYGPDYICHLDGIETYKLRFSDAKFVLLTSKNLFENINFYKIEDNRFVEVSYQSDDEKSALGELSMGYRMEVSLAPEQPYFKASVKSEGEDE